MGSFGWCHQAVLLVHCGLLACGLLPVAGVEPRAADDDGVFLVGDGVESALVLGAVVWGGDHVDVKLVALGVLDVQLVVLLCEVAVLGLLEEGLGLGSVAGRVVLVGLLGGVIGVGVEVDPVYLF